VTSRDVRYLIRPEAIAAPGAKAVRCGACGHAMGKHSDRQIAWCGRHRFMTGTTTPILCEEFKAA